jgi:GNAT superfamily N-acetyltransferase
MTIEIRSAGEQHARVITEVYLDSWNQGFGVRMPVIEADAAKVARWRHDLSAATPTRWWAAFDQNDVLGFVGIGPCRDPVDKTLGELDTIAVRPDSWHLGIGKQLMGVALEGLVNAGYQRAALWTLSDYPLGEHFYRSTGWHSTGDLRNNGNQVRYEIDLTGTDCILVAHDYRTE